MSSDSPSGRAGMEVTQKSLLLGWRDLIDSMGSSALGSRGSIGSSTQVIMTTGYCHNLAPCPSASLPVLGPSDQPHAVEIATLSIECAHSLTDEAGLAARAGHQAKIPAAKDARRSTFDGHASYLLQSAQFVEEMPAPADRQCFSFCSATSQCSGSGSANETPETN